MQAYANASLQVFTTDVVTAVLFWGSVRRTKGFFFFVSSEEHTASDFSLTQSTRSPVETPTMNVIQSVDDRPWLHNPSHRLFFPVK